MPDFPVIDSSEEMLLNTLATIWDAGKQISVVEAMHMMPEISPSTVHRRLKTLRQKGLLALSEDKTDTRVKFIVATPLTHQYFAKLNECLLKAVH